MLSPPNAVYRKSPDSIVGFPEALLMSSNAPVPLTFVIFCRVVDNYGDVGICWRLARQLAMEHGILVTLWVDELASFQRICPQVQLGRAIQEVAGVTVRHWRTQEGFFSAQDVADIVVEFFGCDLPEGYVAAMAARVPHPVWLNLEGLSAEEWVEGCHTLTSPHPRLPLIKHFYFPGFTSRTGGLLHEADLQIRRHHFQADEAGEAGVAAFMNQLGMTAVEIAALKVSLFCYPHACVSTLFEAWQNGSQSITCLAPEGVAVDAVTAFFGAPAIPGAVQTHGALTLRVVPFLTQQDYDRLLWACDINFVRGEDSFVRAQWAGKPFIWHIYPQDKNLHHVKLRAFLQRFAPGIESLNELSLHWNNATILRTEGGVDWAQSWRAFVADQATVTARVQQWQREMLANGDLATNLLHFAASLRSAREQNNV